MICSCKIALPLQTALVPFGMQRLGYKSWRGMWMKKANSCVTKTKWHAIFHLDWNFMLKGLVLRTYFRRKPPPNGKRHRCRLPGYVDEKAKLCDIKTKWHAIFHQIWIYVERSGELMAVFRPPPLNGNWRLQEGVAPIRGLEKSFHILNRLSEGKLRVLYFQSSPLPYIASLNCVFSGLKICGFFKIMIQYCSQVDFLFQC